MSNIDAQLALGGSITGTVTDPNGQPIANINVSANSTTFGPGGIATTDATGSYTIGGLAPGAYTVQFSDFQDDGTCRSSSTTPPARAPPPPSPWPRVRPSRTSTPNSPPAPPSPAPSPTRTANPSPTSASPRSAPPADFGSATTDTDGTYTIKGVFGGLPAGTYTIEFSDTQATVRARVLRQRHQPERRHPRHRDRRPDRVEHQRPTRPGRLDHRHRHRPERPTHRQHQRVREQHDLGPGGSATTDATGNYTISGLAAGTYTVQFSDFQRTVHARVLRQRHRARAPPPPSP